MIITFYIGLIVCLFGLSLFLFQQFWRGVESGIGAISDARNNFQDKLVGLDKVINFDSSKNTHTPSKKGLKITGLFFFGFGLLIILIGYI